MVDIEHLYFMSHGHVKKFFDGGYTFSRLLAIAQHKVNRLKRKKTR